LLKPCAVALTLVATWIGLAASDINAGTPGVWRGDYETGSFSQWLGIQASRTDRAYPVSAVGDTAGTVVSSPVRQGAHAAEFVTYPNQGRSDVDRSEVYASVGATEGTEGQTRYYAWSTMFPAAGNKDGFWPRASDFNVFTQWHNAKNSCGNNVQLGIDSRSGRRGNKIYIDFSTRNPTNCDDELRTRHITLGRLRFDLWYDFVARINWSTDPSVGFCELWMNGVQVLRKTFAQTMGNPGGVYWKQGFYRSAFLHTNTVFQDAAFRGPNFRSVTGPFKLSFVGQPRLASPRNLTISAKSFAQARVRITVRNQSRKILADTVRRADGSGRLSADLATHQALPQRVRVILQALVSPKLPAATRRAAISVKLQ
jgi:hypothetical protein